MTGQSVTAAQSRRSELESAEYCEMTFTDDFMWLSPPCCRLEAELWLFMLSLEATPAKEVGLKPDPATPLKAAPYRRDAETGFVVDRVRIPSLYRICIMLPNWIEKGWCMRVAPQESALASPWCVTEIRTVRRMDLMSNAPLRSSSYVQNQPCPQTLNF